MHTEPHHSHRRALFTAPRGDEPGVALLAYSDRMDGAHFDLTEKIIRAAIAVHRELGPGLLESAYESCLAFELADCGLSFAQQRQLPLVYRGRAIGAGYRVDLIVEEKVIVEVKTVERFEAVHLAQTLSYLRLSGCSVGLLLNFNVKWLSDHGIKRLVHGFPE